MMLGRQTHGRSGRMEKLIPFLHFRPWKGKSRLGGGFTCVDHVGSTSTLSCCTENASYSLFYQSFRRSCESYRKSTKPDPRSPRVEMGMENLFGDPAVALVVSVLILVVLGILTAVVLDILRHRNDRR